MYARQALKWGVTGGNWQIFSSSSSLGTELITTASSVKAVLDWNITLLGVAAVAV